MPRWELEHITFVSTDIREHTVLGKYIVDATAQNIARNIMKNIEREVRCDQKIISHGHPRRSLPKMTRIRACVSYYA